MNKQINLQSFNLQQTKVRENSKSMGIKDDVTKKNRERLASKVGGWGRSNVVGRMSRNQRHRYSNTILYSNRVPANSRIGTKSYTYRYCSTLPWTVYSTSMHTSTYFSVPIPHFDPSIIKYLYIVPGTELVSHVLYHKVKRKTLYW